MMPEPQLEEDLDRLGRLMAPDASPHGSAGACSRASLVERIMEEIEPATSSRPHRTVVARWFIWSGVGLAASALLALACLHVFGKNPAAPAKAVVVNPDPAPALSPSAALPGRLVREIRWQTVDQESVVDDGDVPVRNLRRQEFDRCEYYDAGRHATIQVTVPRSPVILTTMERY